METKTLYIEEAIIDGVKRQDKKRLIISLMMSLGVIYMLCFNIYSFFPDYTKDHHPTINAFGTGVILSAY
jgi:xanthine/uracil permease